MVIEILGWLGSVMVILAYALNIYKKLDSDSVVYYFLNIAGSSLLIINTLYHQAIPSMTVNVVWVLIAIVAIFNKSRRQVGNK
ncbi:MAG: hypothetical protein BGO55_14085 [Sphingobacteriales bacterium 50-39]|nr:hypothetical protein [Sphingobacteriales bacterium]OJW57420.1 MAG: hypothetical protein BGO55_14085 [Sphingobacteriales bacterium 50-39]